MTPARVLQVFRSGKDTLDIANMREVCDAMPDFGADEREAAVVCLIAQAREEQRACRTAELKARVAHV